MSRFFSFSLFTPFRLLAFLSLMLPLFASAQSQAVSDEELRLRTIKGLQLRTKKLLGMAGKYDAFMSAHEEEAKTISEESYKSPGKLFTAPDAAVWYTRALKLNRIADDMIAGGKGDTSLNPWKRYTPEDLAQRILVTNDLCEKCLSEEMNNAEKVIRWMQEEVGEGEMTLPDFVDMTCQMIDRFHNVVTGEPMPATLFFNVYDLADRKQVVMLNIRINRLMSLTFQNRAFLNAGKKQIENLNALVDIAREKGETPALKKEMDILARELLVIADDILAGGDGTAARKPWKQFTPEDLLERMKQLNPFFDYQDDYFELDKNFRKMALQINAGQLSVGDFIDNMYLDIDSIIAEQNCPAKPDTKKN